MDRGCIFLVILENYDARCFCLFGPPLYFITIGWTVCMCVSDDYKSCTSFAAAFSLNHPTCFLLFSPLLISPPVFLFPIHTPARFFFFSMSTPERSIFNCQF
eukprot:GEMP01059879.1.p1 GENE.GEMP01059879.1~~GEMP01059879.1.p1  ORF type:complete len:102 (+),score=5.18 GEMP01059879.1:698-1003(+)